jgi:hypothetical protein
MEEYFSNDYIGIFDGFYSQDFCNDVIKLFEFRNDFRYRISRDGEKQQDESITLGHEIDFIANNTIEELVAVEDAPRMIRYFSEIFWNKCYKEYTKDYVYNEQLKNLQFSNFKIQKTLPGQGYHTFHFENQDISTSRRVMFIILYLNDIEDGGETEFLYQKKRIHPKTGRLILAPASYTHVHRGNPPLSKEKYIMTSWIEYTS